MGGRSPLAQLLHALNQPLTGLQCSMEVALASPRTAEQYAQGLREGLELTERMRALVEAIREVSEVEPERNCNANRNNNGNGNNSRNDEEVQAVELRAVLREVVNDLAPVAEVNSVRVSLVESATASLALPATASPRRLATDIFRTLESVLSLAARGTVLRIDADELGFQVRWQAAQPPSDFSRPGLGLLVAQSGLERAGAAWQRERTEEFETVTVRLPGVLAVAGASETSSNCRAGDA
jgi:signal transduction histidine kinase